MMKPVYIKSASSISPQQHFEDNGFLQDIKTLDDGVLYITDPNYRRYINPVAIRRMSKLLKMGISTGLNALEQAGVKQPDAIIAGTGRGSMVDTEKFLLDMIHQEEEALTPTSFIQSTYNSVNGWLAVHTKSSGYNQTYVHRGTSLELSLLDAQMLLNESDTDKNVLAGCFDEITEDYVRVKSKLGYWKNAVKNLDLHQQNDTEGTIPGEGAAFFVISNNANDALCRMSAVRTLQNATDEAVWDNINQLLRDNHISPDDIDVLLLGTNGDCRQRATYDHIISKKAENTSVAAFKHLCGEYDTSSGFAIWAATEIFSTQNLPEVITLQKGSHESIKNILVANHYILNSTSLILLQQ